MEDLERLVAEHYGRVRRRIAVVVRDAAAADDLAQETILVYLKALERGSRIENPPAFLKGIARVLVVEYLREKRRSPQFLADLVAEDWPAPGDQAPDESSLELRTLLEGLGQKERTIILGRHYYGLTLAAIGEQLNMPVATVHLKYSQAMERLRRTARQRDR